MPGPLIVFMLLSMLGTQGLRGQTDQLRRIDGWTLRVRADPFTGTVGCRLTSGRVEVRRDAVVFHLPRTTDTFEAVYRVDQGAPRSVREDEARLASMGFAVHEDNLDNPSGGVVRIPLEALSSARRVFIEDHPGGRVRGFDLAGLSSALAALKPAGCNVLTMDGSPPEP